MRILSQSGLTDIPYEKFWLQVEVVAMTRNGDEKYGVRAYSTSNDDSILLGKYDTQVEAIVVLKKIITANRQGSLLFKMPDIDKVE